MGRLPTGNRKYNIQGMWDIHHEILRLLLIGMKPVEVAKTLNISPVTVSYTANSPIAKRRLEVMRGARDADALDVSQQIRDLCPAAVRVLEDSLSSDLEGNRLKASLAILDRAGYAPVQRIKAEHSHTHFTVEEIDDIKKRARDLIVDVTPEDAEVEGSTTLPAVVGGGR